MSEKRLIVDGIVINYNGLFEIDSLLKTIDAACNARGYVKQEKEREERVYPSGKELFFELRPVKKMTDYFTLMIKIKLNIKNMEEVEITKDRMRMLVNKGNVKMIFDAWTTTDYEGRWEQKPLFYFLRNLFERFVYIVHTDKFTGELDSDCHYIYNQIKAHLELHKFETVEHLPTP